MQNYSRVGATGEAESYTLPNPAQNKNFTTTFKIHGCCTWRRRHVRRNQFSKPNATDENSTMPQQMQMTTALNHPGSVCT